MDGTICIDELKSLPEIIELKEHHQFHDDYVDAIRGLNIRFCETDYECAPKYLGMHPETLCASYFIGADWLVEGKHAIVVTPKMNIDFIEMFMCALKFEKAANYFSKFYGIDFDKKPIKTSAFNNQITPLIVIHYIGLLKQIIKRGLKRDYVLREENLQSKVKGKIKITQHIKKNIIPKREDRVYCQYQEYTIDSVENRILKKALLFADQYIASMPPQNLSLLKTTINSLKASFNSVSDNVEMYELRSISKNKIYKEYSEAIRTAKMILRKFNYSITDVQTDIRKEFTPAFWIDMSRLYEVYVYSKLYEKFGDRIQFQVPGYWKTAVDFVDIKDNLIIDTKYKPQYNEGNGGIIDDVRQISAYARDEKILKSMGVEDERFLKCLIIYPEKMIDDKYKETEGRDDCKELVSFQGIDNILSNSTEIKAYKGFYKLSFPMPITKSNDVETSD
ncbi:MAG: 5-methylcytosine restriction system specificity protein McrC [Bacteroidales bacterium]